MKPTTALAVAVALLAAPAAWAQPVSARSGPDTYLQLNLGAYLPQSSDLSQLDPGVALSGTFGAMFSPNVGAEATIGYHRAATNLAGGLDTSVNVLPVMASVRLVAPLKFMELSARAGVGVHFANRHVWSETASAFDTATAFGWQVGAGVAFNLWPTMVVGLDVLAPFATAKFGGQSTSLDGLIVSVTLGYKL